MNADTGTIRASRCFICRRPLVEGRPGGQGFTTSVQIDKDGAAHTACADAETIAGRLTAAFVGGMIDTRRMIDDAEARARRIELLVAELRDGITTAIIGAGNRGEG